MIFVTLIYSGKLFAATQSLQNIRPKPWKITEQQFLDQYGKDDSSRALIRYYFERKRKTRKSTSNLAIITGGFAIISGGVFISTRNSASDNLAVPFVAFLATSISALLTLLFGVALISMNRRYLFKLLQKYHSGKGIPRKITEWPLFEKLLETEKHHS